MPLGRLPGFRFRHSTSNPRLLHAAMEGISVYNTLAGAIEQNEVMKKRGKGFQVVATLDIPKDSGIVCDDEFGNDAHYDLYGATRAEFVRLVTPPDHKL